MTMPRRPQRPPYCPDDPPRPGRVAPPRDLDMIRHAAANIAHGLEIDPADVERPLASAFRSAARSTTGGAPASDVARSIANAAPPAATPADLILVGMLVGAAAWFGFEENAEVDSWAQAVTEAALSLPHRAA